MAGLSKWVEVLANDPVWSFCQQRVLLYWEHSLPLLRAGQRNFLESEHKRLVNLRGALDRAYSRSLSGEVREAAVIILGYNSRILGQVREILDSGELTTEAVAEARFCLGRVYGEFEFLEMKMGDELGSLESARG